jgi:hypothetical protein
MFVLVKVILSFINAHGMFFTCNLFSLLFKGSFVIANYSKLFLLFACSTSLIDFVESFLIVINGGDKLSLFIFLVSFFFDVNSVI